MARQEGVDVDHRHAVDRPRRNAFESTRQTGDVGRHLRLRAPDDDILAPRLAPAAFVEQTIGLADARGRTPREGASSCPRRLDRSAASAWRSSVSGSRREVCHATCLPPNHQTRPTRIVV